MVRTFFISGNILKIVMSRFILVNERVKTMIKGIIFCVLITRHSTFVVVNNILCRIEGEHLLKVGHRIRLGGKRTLYGLKVIAYELF